MNIKLKRVEENPSRIQYDSDVAHMIKFIQDSSPNPAAHSFTDSLLARMGVGKDLTGFQFWRLRQIFDENKQRIERENKS